MQVLLEVFVLAIWRLDGTWSEKYSRYGAPNMGQTGGWENWSRCGCVGRFSMSCLLSNVKDKFNWVFIGVYDPNDDRVSSW